MRVWFLARNHLPFSPASVHVRQLGGSELALYHVAKRLAGLGHGVVVVNRCGPEAGLFDGVRYYDAAHDALLWRREARLSLPDVLVLCRRMLDIVAGIPARAKVFWAHDYQGLPMVVPRSGIGRQLSIVWRRATGPLFVERVDRVFAISRFLADVFRWLYHTPAEKLVVIPQGVETEHFAGPFPPRGPLRFIYTSTPDRGLVLLLRDIFPAIRRVCPEAELHLHSYASMDAYKRFSIPGVHFHGWVPRPELVRSLQQSALMLYPSNCEEMGCIAVLEAMAAGTPAVTSSLGVLSELAGNGSRGIAVEGWPGTTDFSRRFVEATTSLLSDTGRLDRMRASAREYAITRHGWDTIAVLWHQMLHATLEATTGRK